MIERPLEPDYDRIEPDYEEDLFDPDVEARIEEMTLERLENENKKEIESKN